MVEREVPRDRENPGATLAGFCGRRPRARDAEEHFLREIARDIGLTDDPRQISEDAVPVLGEDRGGIGHALHSMREEPRGRAILSSSRRAAGPPRRTAPPDLRGAASVQLLRPD